MLFFAKTIQNIISHYGRLFDISDEEDDEEGNEPTEEDRNTEEDRRTSSPLAQYGIMTYVIELVPITGMNIHDILELPVAEIFYLTCLKIDYNKVKEMSIEKWKKTH